MPNPTRVKLEVYVDLDPVPGTFNNKESARSTVEYVLNQTIPHYNPAVTIPSEKE